ncbi:hypothetical protein ACFVRD_45395 [Streptomyces sp. NPDC057908]|uniref:hypothetical protein n=1 Tax=Streptomyces sp. NPDC057908 TaxID=3346276 RepID=UPI0036F169AE
MSEDLPKEALKTVIEALCAPAKNPHGFGSQADRWREEALKAALPALLARTSARRLRSRLLVHADEKTLAALAAEGTVTAVDLPTILRTCRVWAGLISALARHPGQVEAAIALLPRLASHEVERVVRDWDPDLYTRAAGAAPAPPLPQALFDAVLEACLTPLAAYLLLPEPKEGWEAVSTFSKDWSLELGGHSGWAMLARCPERWAELTAHPTFGGGGERRPPVGAAPPDQLHHEALRRAAVAEDALVLGPERPAAAVNTQLPPANPAPAYVPAPIPAPAQPQPPAVQTPAPPAGPAPFRLPPPPVTSHAPVFPVQGSPSAAPALAPAPAPAQPPPPPPRTQRATSSRNCSRNS